jgi:hypothetical protein
VYIKYPQLRIRQLLSKLFLTDGPCSNEAHARRQFLEVEEVVVGQVRHVAKTGHRRNARRRTRSHLRCLGPVRKKNSDMPVGTKRVMGGGAAAKRGTGSDVR